LERAPSRRGSPRRARTTRPPISADGREDRRRRPRRGQAAASSFRPATPPRGRARREDDGATRPNG